VKVLQDEADLAEGLVQRPGQACGSECVSNGCPAGTRSSVSLGFHAPQEGARILGEAIDYARQAQARILRRQ
jgi:hypothetical protein